MAVSQPWIEKDFLSPMGLWGSFQSPLYSLKGNKGFKIRIPRLLGISQCFWILFTIKNQPQSTVRNVDIHSTFSNYVLHWKINYRSEWKNETKILLPRQTDYPYLSRSYAVRWPCLGQWVPIFCPIVSWNWRVGVRKTMETDRVALIGSYIRRWHK